MSTSGLYFEAMEPRLPGLQSFLMGKGQPRRRIYLKEWREHRGYSQEKLAELTDRTIGNISKIERGLTDFTGTSLREFAIALECDELDILTRPPTEYENLWKLYGRASPEARRQFERMAQALLGPEKPDPER